MVGGIPVAWGGVLKKVGRMYVLYIPMLAAGTQVSEARNSRVLDELFQGTCAYT